MNSATRFGAPLLVLAALIATPGWLTSSYFKFMLILVFTYVIVAIGINLLFGYAGLLSLGHAALMAVGAYVSAIVSKALGVFPVLVFVGAHVWIAMIAGTIAAGIAGAILAVPALRVKGPYLAMVTIAFGWVIWRVLLEWVPVTGGDLGIGSIPKPRFAGHLFTITEFYYFDLAAVVIALLIQRNLVRSHVGRRIVAVKHSEEAAESVGLSVYREKVWMFITSALFAGFGGALFAHLQTYISPDNFQFFSSVFFVLAVLFGGAGTLSGPVLGAAFLTILPEFLHDAERFRLVIYGTITLATLYVLPRGIVSLVPASLMLRPQQARNDEEQEAAASPPSMLKPGGGAIQPRGPIVSVENIEKSFGGVKAVGGVSLSIAGGTVHALIGPNGAGKTTLINIISGSDRPDLGKLLVDGVPTTLSSPHAAVRRGIARTFQTIKLFGDMTAREHVMVSCEARAHPSYLRALLRTARYRHEERQRWLIADGLLRLTNLIELAEVPANSLSYGHRRLLEIARALATQPQLLLLDEPAAGLVAEEIERLAQLIRTLRSQGIAILLVEHHMDLVMGVSDVVTVLDYGKVISVGDPATVQNDPRVIEAYLGIVAG